MMLNYESIVILETDKMTTIRSICMLPLYYQNHVHHMKLSQLLKLLSAKTMPMLKREKIIMIIFMSFIYFLGIKYMYTRSVNMLFVLLNNDLTPSLLSHYLKVNLNIIKMNTHLF